MDQATVNGVLGPISLSVNLNFFVFGVIALQFYKYFEHDYRDPWPIKLLVWWLIISNTSATAIDGYFSWQYTIANFNNPAILRLSTWAYSVVPIWTVLVLFPVQLFFAYRVLVLSNRKLWTIIIVVLATIQFFLGIGTGVYALLISPSTDFSRIQPILAVWFSANVGGDILISTILVICLRAERRGFRITDHIINRIMRGVIETACLSCLFSMGHLIFFFGTPATSIHLIFSVPLGRIYSNAFLATLNARTSFRQTLNASEGTSITGGGMERRTHQKDRNAVISVEREVHLEDLSHISKHEMDRFSSDEVVSGTKPTGLGHF